MPSNRWTMCVTCRKAWRGAPTCQHEVIDCPRDYRVPKKSNDKAWKMIANGDLYWGYGRWGRPDRSRVQMKPKKERDALLTRWLQLRSKINAEYRTKKEQLL